MNILLIYPEYPNTFWSFKYALAFIRKRAAHPPLGLLTVAAMLPPDWSVRLVDTNVRRLRQADLAWADCAFISAMTIQRAAACRIIAQCREAKLRIVAGGPLFSGDPTAFADVDHLVLNEAELTLPGFLNDLALGTAKHLYTTTEFANMHQSPTPRWELLDQKRYASMSVQFSRGCPFNCDFCNVTALLGHRVRTKTSAQIIAELDSLYAHGWREEVFFVDDNFIGNKNFLRTDLLPALIAWRKHKKGMPFYTEASIDLAEDVPLMQTMVAAGFTRVFIGIETPDDACLAECKKVQNKNRDLLADVKRIQQNGIEVQGGFIVGFDHDSPSIFRRQIDFIQQSGIVTAMVGLLQAPPGTRLHERLNKEGRLRGESSGDNVDGSTNIMPVMDVELLLSGYREILRHIYSPKHYYERLRVLLRNIGAIRCRAPLRFWDIHALLLSFWRLGVVGRERFQYWRLLTWTLCHRPRLLPQAVTLAIYGYHFRIMCDRHVV